MKKNFYFFFLATLMVNHSAHASCGLNINHWVDTEADDVGITLSQSIARALAPVVAKKNYTPMSQLSAGALALEWGTDIDDYFPQSGCTVYEAYVSIDRVVKTDGTYLETEQLLTTTSKGRICKPSDSERDAFIQKLVIRAAQKLKNCTL